MLGRKAKKITDLEQRLHAMQSDPFYEIAQDLGREVIGLVSAGADTDPRINEAIDRQRQALFLARVNQLAQAQIEQDTDAEKAAIEAQALAKANEIAAVALRSFQENEADAYRAAVETRLRKERPEIVLEEAKNQIEQEVRQRLVAFAKPKLLAAQTPEDQRQQLRDRAEVLRIVTKRSNYLNLEDLMDNDPIELVFSRSEYGFGTRYLSGRLLNVSDGTLEIEKDVWHSTQDKPLPAGQHIQIGVENLLEDELQRRIVRGRPLTLQSLEGDTLPGSELHVLRMELGGNRVFYNS